MNDTPIDLESLFIVLYLDIITICYGVELKKYIVLVRTNDSFKSSLILRRVNTY